MAAVFMAARHTCYMRWTNPYEIIPFSTLGPGPTARPSFTVPNVRPVQLPSVGGDADCSRVGVVTRGFPGTPCGGDRIVHWLFIGVSTVIR